MTTPEEKNEQETASPFTSTSFMREQIKQRPINKGKLLRRTLITVLLAGVFGVVACITFLLLQPFISSRLYPEPEAVQVTFPEESAEAEMSPEEMYADDEAIAQEAADVAQEEVMQEEARIRSLIRQESERILRAAKLDITSYRELNAAMRQLIAGVNCSLVTVTAITPDTNWINDPFERSGSTSGLLIAENGADLLILTSAEAVMTAQELYVTFVDNTVADATIRMTDRISGLAVLQVSLTALTEETKTVIEVAQLGSSSVSANVGTPVLAVGSPVGVQGSIGQGMIIADRSQIDLPDVDLKLIETDITGSSNGSGILIDLSGQVIGVIDMAYADSEAPTRLVAIGITELKPLIENLSNERESAFLGIHGTDVPVAIRREMAIPEGAYVLRTELDSPAMLAGLQSGDIISAVGEEPVGSFAQLTGRLAQLPPDEEVTLHILRQIPESYIPLEVTITPIAR
ncbi:MAG: serine protease [Butyrivibrio sp.]|nr:serine protease [Butyrivibrio sp.]